MQQKHKTHNIQKNIYLDIALMLCLVFSVVCSSHLYAQRHMIMSPEVKSLQVVAGDRWQEMPIIRLNGKEKISISFDVMSHEYKRLTYTVNHLESDFSESTDLFPSDFIEGFQSGNTIDDYEHSINTIQNYTHYTFQLPNSKCAPKISGNYRVDVIDESIDSVIVSAFFFVYENVANVSIEQSPVTDIDTRRSHQQVSLRVDYSKLNAFNPQEQIKGYVLQNFRWDNRIVLPYPTRLNQQYLEWTHCKELIFNAGNEYHKFEILDIHRNSMNVENNTWDGNEWHTYLWADYNRPSYVYDETPKGAFYIRNSDNTENDVTSEYVNVHFILKTEKINNPIYVNGIWTNDWLADDYRMNYNNKEKQYELIVPLKYGYYSYQYISKDNDGESIIPPSEGSYWETKNYYNALIYYRGNTDRTDRLVGIAQCSKLTY